MHLARLSSLVAVVVAPMLVIAACETSTTVPTPTAVSTQPTIVPLVVPSVIPTLAPTTIPTVVATAIPTVLPTAIPTVAPIVTPPAAPTVVPPAVPAKPTAVTATLVPTVAPTPASPAVITPVASPTKAAALPADFAAKARGITEYSYDFKLTAAGQAFTTGKSFLKGAKVRVEATAGGQDLVTLADTQTKIAYMLLKKLNVAMKIDYSKVQVPIPAEELGTLPPNSIFVFVGNDTFDGKPASVYEVPGAQLKFWIWTERGLPLKSEKTTSIGKSTVEYTNYQFGALADSLFELPPGTQLQNLQLPSNLPSFTSP